ncbi:MAG TPA: MFS transporter, partial [Pseudonocardia sp.]|nr:MFS transporter [Pseudonocardia sp.]
MAQPTRSDVQLRRAVLSSFIGTVIEYYDFLLYATASAVVFNRVFFSPLDPLAGTVASFGALATGYLARPLGGVLFGHFGDRIGRKRMLVLTMALMGVASVLIGLLPTYDQVGVLAPVLLVVLRIAQGVAVGGEWGGAVLMSAEHATTRRGLWASFTNAGAPSGMVLSTLVLALAAATTGEQAFLAWGWRIPFLLSAVLLAVGLFVRAKVEETPVFTAAEAAPQRPPLLDVL